jgi:hypothetical protein
VTTATELLVSPVLTRDGGFAFDTFERGTGLCRGFVYRRVEHADRDRKATLRGQHHPRRMVTAVDCTTLVDFHSRQQRLAATA